MNLKDLTNEALIKKHEYICEDVTNLDSLVLKMGDESNFLSGEELENHLELIREKKRLLMRLRSEMYELDKELQSR